MSLLRSVWADLVEKRLWPLLVLLVAALVAVPLMLTRTAEPSPGTPPPLSRAAQAGAAERLALDATATDGAQGAAGRDPFEQLHVPKPPAQEADDPADAPTDGGSGAPGPSAGTQPEQGDAGAVRGSGGRISIRFGTPGRLRRMRGLERLAPLPSRSDPFFVFLGVRPDGHTAVFLVSSDAKGTGDGSCRPSRSVCSTVEMRAGDTEFFDLTQDDGSITQYQLDLLSVTSG